MNVDFLLRSIILKMQGNALTSLSTPCSLQDKSVHDVAVHTACGFLPWSAHSVSSMEDVQVCRGAICSINTEEVQDAAYWVLTSRVCCLDCHESMSNKQLLL